MLFPNAALVLFKQFSCQWKRTNIKNVNLGQKSQFNNTSLWFLDKANINIYQLTDTASYFHSKSYATSQAAQMCLTIQLGDTRKILLANSQYYSFLLAGVENRVPRAPDVASTNLEVTLPMRGAS